MADKLRKLKDEAAKLLQKGKSEQALAILNEIREIDPLDVTACQKAGDIYKELERTAEAIEAYQRVVHVYAEDGLLLKAIAACKEILDIDPDHSHTQKLLADLYAKKTGRAAAVAQKVGVPAAAASAGAPPTLVDTDQLPTIPLFSDLTKNAFIQLMEQMEMRSVLPGEVIIREGDVDDSMFIISSGKVKITKTGETGEELVLAHLSDGAFFGEMALLSQAPRTASVIAEEDTQLFEVNRAVLDQVVKNFPSVKHTLMRFYRQRLLANLMATSPIFKPLDGDQRKALIEKFKSREVPANEKVLEEGQPGDGLYMLLSGQAEVSTKVNNRREVLAHLKGGDVFGELALLRNQPVNANIKTLRKSIVLKLPKRVFSEIISTHPQLLAHITELATEREKLTQAIMTGKMRFSEEGLVVV